MHHRSVVVIKVESQEPSDSTILFHSSIAIHNLYSGLTLSLILRDLSAVHITKKKVMMACTYARIIVKY